VVLSQIVQLEPALSYVNEGLTGVYDDVYNDVKD